MQHSVDLLLLARHAFIICRMRQGLDGELTVVSHCRAHRYVRLRRSYAFDTKPVGFFRQQGRPGGPRKKESSGAKPRDAQCTVRSRQMSPDQAMQQTFQG